MRQTETLLNQCSSLAAAAFPGERQAQLASDASIYLAHVDGGASMRSLAAVRGAHPSTVMRAVRRVEQLRDDPLIDLAISELETVASAERAGEEGAKSAKEPEKKASPRLDLDESKALRLLCDAESFLLVASGAERAGVFCRKNQFRRPLALISLEQAKSFVSFDWIRCASKTATSAKYEATSVARAAVRRMVGDAKAGMDSPYAEPVNVFAGQHQLPGERRIVNHRTGEVETIRVNLGESPLGWLARRKDRNGNPFLDAAMVEAGERLRSDFELAQIGPRVAQDWRRFLTPRDGARAGGSACEGPRFARERVAQALDFIGPDLADVALRVCCFLEGLEATERRMGWAARSGKVVLQLALRRLVDHYGLEDGAQKRAVN